MNIQLLLSGAQNQGSSSTAKQPLSNTLDSSQGIFRQALSQAANAPLRSTDVHTSNAEPATALAQQLQDLGVEIGEDDLASLLGQLSLAGDEAMDSQLALDTPTNEALTPLEEIAERLKLVAVFSEMPAAQDSLVAVPTLESIAQQLAISEEKAADLISALDQLIDPTESEFASVSSALSTLLAPLQGDNKQVANAPAESFRYASSSLASTAQSVLGRVSDWDTTLSKPLNTSAPVSGHQPAPLSNAQEALATQAFLAPLGNREIAPAFEDLAPLRPNQLAASFQPSAPASQASTMLSPFISTSVTSPAWPSQLGQQLVQFTQRGGEQQVQMQLHPAELGPLAITLKVTEQGTQAHFLSAHAQVRQIVEQAIPQLRETLAEQGISLGETSVGEQQNPQEQAFAQQGKGSGSAGKGSVTGSDSAVVLPVSENTALMADGRVDLYA
ncbi:flagellar hook-length control protein FliK [Vreelandella populi]|nr:flagellar hook-length control protein FliK [Halomonas populi]